MSSSVSLHKEQHGRYPLAKSGKPCNPFLPTYSPQEGYLKESEDILSGTELWGNMADHSKSNEDNCDQYLHSQLDNANSRDVRREELFRHFYQTIQKELHRERPSDCIIIFLGKELRAYATAIGQRLQDHGLVVEMIHLMSEAALTRALQEVKQDGSPFCILVEGCHLELSSCTVILLHESIKIHRHILLEDALVLVAEEFRRICAERERQEHAGISLRAGALVTDSLARERFTRCTVPSGIRHLLFLLTEGKHLYVNELNLIIDYLKTRKQQLEGFETPEPLTGSGHSSLQGRNTPTVGKPPPLLPTSERKSLLGPPPTVPIQSSLLGDRPAGGLLPLPGLVKPKGLLPTPMHPVGSSKRPAPLGYCFPRPAKRPLLGEKPGFLAPPPGF